MQLLAFDSRMGASGDMLLGALLAAGADPAVLDPVETTLDLQYDISTDSRCAIAGTNVQVHRSTEDAGDGPDDATAGDDDGAGDKHPSHSHDHQSSHTHDHHTSHSHDHQSSHTHDHQSSHTHDHQSSHSHDHHGTGDHTNDGPTDESHSEQGSHDHSHEHAEGSGPNRSFTEVIDLVESMDLPSSVEADATAVFELLGTAEASVHGTDLDSIHFHEVGADDAIADIVGVALLLADIDPDRIVTTPVAAGAGDVRMSHGVYPVPAPAVVELAEQADWELRGGPVERELLTPTGAAILAHFTEGVDTLPTMDIEESGYGIGTMSFDSHPNVLRAMTGQVSEGFAREPVTVLETNLDDATPEMLGGLQESLTAAGALDVTILPATMKKSRPGHLVKVIVPPEQAAQVAKRLAVETGTLGVREHGRGHRWVADRERRSVSVDVGDETAEITVKIGKADDTVFDVSAEFDDAQAVALEHDLSVRDVMRRAETIAYDELGTK